jgi:hypothetical protein
MNADATTCVQKNILLAMRTILSKKICRKYERLLNCWVSNVSASRDTKLHRAAVMDVVYRLPARNLHGISV